MQASSEFHCKHLSLTLFAFPQQGRVILDFYYEIIAFSIILQKYYYNFYV